MKKRILVTPLNWGLGHATRCIPIIKALIEHGFEPLIASDGVALELLKKEFSDLQHFELPSYHIEYPRNSTYFKLKFLTILPKLLKAIKFEKKIIKEIVKRYKIDGIINDNRFGVYHKTIPTVYVTHQLNVLSGNTTWLSSKIHQYIIKKFDECWVLDTKNEPHLSGRLGHINHFSIPVKYLGILSRFNKIDVEKKYDLMVLLSGPEPQRTLLEKLLFEQITDYKGTVLFVKGIIENTQTKTTNGNITIVNFMESCELETALNQSDIILSRSGYTTILDLATLSKKVFFIPTPGQFEQEYLAKRFSDKGIAPFSTQDNFTIDKLDLLKDYSGFEGFENTTVSKELFSLFERK